MNENQSGAGHCTGHRIETRSIWRPPVAGCNVQRKRAMTAVTCVTDCRVIAQGLVRVRGAKRRIDLLLRIDPPVPEPVGMRGIVRRSLMPNPTSRVVPSGLRKLGWAKSSPKSRAATMQPRFVKGSYGMANASASLGRTESARSSLSWIPNRRAALRLTTLGSRRIVQASEAANRPVQIRWKSGNNSETRRDLIGILQANNSFNDFLFRRRFNLLGERGIHVEFFKPRDG